MLVLTRFAETTQVHRVNAPGGARTQLTFLDDRVLEASPRPGREQFVYTTDEGGAENFQISFLDIPSGNSRRLTDGKSRNVLGKWSHSGRAFAFSGNARNGNDMDLYIATPDESRPPRLLKEVHGSWTVTDWAPDGRRLVALEYVSINESYVHVVDVRTGQSEQITPRPAEDKPRVAYADARWMKDGSSLIWMSDDDSEYRRLECCVISSKAVGVIPQYAQNNCDVEQFDLSDDGSRLIVAWNVDGVSAMAFVRPEDGVEMGQVKLPRGRVVGLKFLPNSNSEVAFGLTTAKVPGDVYSCTQNGVVTHIPNERWTCSETGGLNTSQFIEADVIRYPSHDGKAVPAFVYYPDPEKFPGPRPVLITIHGGPESQFRPGWLGFLNYWLEEKGVALVFPNVRGSAGYGKSYLLLDNGEKREDAVKDIGSLLDWIGKDPGLDAKRVAVSGGSYGGYMSLATMTHYSDRLQAGIDIVGISSFLTFLKNTKGYRLDLRRAEYGDERDPKMYAHLEAISPLSNAAKIKVPLLIVQGKNDPRVPLSESEQMLAAVKKNGGPVWYVLGKNEGHGFAKKVNQDYLQNVEALFLHEIFAR